MSASAADPTSTYGPSPTHTRSPQSVVALSRRYVAARIAAERSVGVAGDGGGLGEEVGGAGVAWPVVSGEDVARRRVEEVREAPLRAEPARQKVRDVDRRLAKERGRHLLGLRVGEAASVRGRDVGRADSVERRAIADHGDRRAETLGEEREDELHVGADRQGEARDGDPLVVGLPGKEIVCGDVSRFSVERRGDAVAPGDQREREDGLEGREDRPLADDLLGHDRGAGRHDVPGESARDELAAAPRALDDRAPRHLVERRRVVHDRAEERRECGVGEEQTAEGPRRHARSSPRAFVPRAPSHRSCAAGKATK